MGKQSQSELVIGVSSQALFDLREEEAILQSLGPKAFCDYQIAQEEIALEPGSGFDLARSLLRLNEIEGLDLKVSLVLMSPNNADSSVRLFRSIEAHDLDVQRVVLTSGDVTARYLKAFKVDLYLSDNADEVRDASHEGTAAAIINAGSNAPAIASDQIRIAFDSEAMIFSEESDRIFEEGGIEAFVRYEQENVSGSDPQGPFAKLSKGLAAFQSQANDDQELIRTSLIADRRTPEVDRVLHAFRTWNLRLGEAFFLDGISKQEVIDAFQPHIVFTNDLEGWEAEAQGEAEIHTPSGIHSLPGEQAA